MPPSARTGRVMSIKRGARFEVAANKLGLDRPLPVPEIPSKGNHLYIPS